MSLRTILVLILGLPLAARSQHIFTYLPDRATPYDPEGDYRTWSIKGKVLPFELGNGGGVSGLLGVEYSFAKNQSIGMDGFVELQENSDDMVKDTAGVSHATGSDFNSFERAVFLNYRYYFGLQRLRKRGITLYLVAFVRYGKLNAGYDPLYPLSYYYKKQELDKSAGLLIGSTLSLTRRLGLDVNFGLFEKEKVIDTEFLQHGVVSWTHWTPVEMGFRLSANLVYWFAFKKNKNR